VPLPAQATTYTQSLSVALAPSQISTQEVIHSGLIKTLWECPALPLTQATLVEGDNLSVNLKFDKLLRATDLQNTVDTNEMIYWCFTGAGSLATNLDMAYVWQFTSASGSLFSPSIAGNGLLRRLLDGSIQGVINVSETMRELNLTDGSFAFGGIRLTLSIPQIASGWTPTTLRLNFASDGLAILPSGPPRRLNISRDSPVRLSWSTDLVGFGVQTTTNLSSASAWTTALPTPAILGTNCVVTNTLAGPSRCFRLSNWPQRRCVSNLKQIGLALKTWALDSQDLFPFQVPTSQGGTRELRAPGPDGFDTNAYAHFLVMSNQLGVTSILVCPGDLPRTAATNFPSLRPQNVTYRLRTGDTVTDTNPGEIVAVCPIDGNTLYSDGSVTDGISY
jgi:hypothetical protein